MNYAIDCIDHWRGSAEKASKVKVFDIHPVQPWIAIVTENGWLALYDVERKMTLKNQDLVTIYRDPQWLSKTEASILGATQSYSKTSFGSPLVVKFYDQVSTEYYCRCSGTFQFQFLPQWILVLTSSTLIGYNMYNNSEHFVLGPSKLPERPTSMDVVSYHLIAIGSADGSIRIYDASRHTMVKMFHEQASRKPISILQSILCYDKGKGKKDEKDEDDETSDVFQGTVRWFAYSTEGVAYLYSMHFTGNILEGSTFLRKIDNMPLSIDWVHLDWHGSRLYLMSSSDKLVGRLDISSDDLMVMKSPEVFELSFKYRSGCSTASGCLLASSSSSAMGTLIHVRPDPTSERGVEETNLEWDVSLLMEDMQENENDDDDDDDDDEQEESEGRDNRAPKPIGRSSRSSKLRRSLKQSKKWKAYSCKSLRGQHSKYSMVVVGSNRGVFITMFQERDHRMESVFCRRRRMFPFEGTGEQTCVLLHSFGDVCKRRAVVPPGHDSELVSSTPDDDHFGIGPLKTMWVSWARKICAMCSITGKYRLYRIVENLDDVSLLEEGENCIDVSWIGSEEDDDNFILVILKRDSARNGSISIAWKKVSNEGIVSLDQEENLDLASAVLIAREGPYMILGSSRVLDESTIEVRATSTIELPNADDVPARKETKHTLWTWIAYRWRHGIIESTRDISQILPTALLASLYHRSSYPELRKFAQEWPFDIDWCEWSPRGRYLCLKLSEKHHETWSTRRWQEVLVLIPSQSLTDMPWLSLQMHLDVPWTNLLPHDHVYLSWVQMPLRFASPAFEEENWQRPDTSYITSSREKSSEDVLVMRDGKTLRFLIPDVAEGYVVAQSKIHHDLTGVLGVTRDVSSLICWETNETDRLCVIPWDELGIDTARGSYISTKTSFILDSYLRNEFEASISHLMNSILASMIQKDVKKLRALLFSNGDGGGLSGNQGMPTSQLSARTTESRLESIVEAVSSSSSDRDMEESRNRLIVLLAVFFYTEDDLDGLNSLLHFCTESRNFKKQAVLVAPLFKDPKLIMKVHEELGRFAEAAAIAQLVDKPSVAILLKRFRDELMSFQRSHEGPSQQRHSS